MLLQYSPLDVFLLALLVVSGVIQLGYLIFLYNRLNGKRKVNSAQGARGYNPPLSVIIAARNEAANLEAYLPVILKQDYPEFEVVVVNDASWDDTSFVLNKLKAKHENLSVVNIPESRHPFRGKKMALTMGIKAARYGHFVFTDADCRPASDRWLRRIAEGFRPGIDLVIGYGAYESSPGLLNRMIRTDALFAAVNYISLALAGKPYMGVGRNLGYTREVYQQAGGFRKHYHIASGDDDLLVHQVARADNTLLALDPDGYTFTPAKNTWRSWWKQKRRHLSTGPLYRASIKFLLLGYPVSFLLMFVAGICLLVSGKFQSIVLSIWVVRLLVQFFIFRRSTEVLKQKDLVWTLPWLEPLVLLFNAVAQVANLFSKPVEWKR